jgi:hypothetical protein
LSQTLGVPSVGIHASFFELGANSMDMVAYQSRLKTVMNLDVRLVQLFEHSTVAALAAALTSDGSPGQVLTDSDARGTQRRARLRASRGGSTGSDASAP